MKKKFIFSIAIILCIILNCIFFMACNNTNSDVDEKDEQSGDVFSGDVTDDEQSGDVSSEDGGDKTSGDVSSEGSGDGTSGDVSEEEKFVEDSTYIYKILNDSELEIAGLKVDEDSLTNVTIPEKFDDYTVSGIGNSVFHGCQNIIELTIPESIKSIGEQVFVYCTGLTSVFYEGDLTSWCNIKFKDYYSNPMVYAAELYIDNELLQGELVIPANINAIKDNAFAGYQKITSVIIPDGVTEIGAGAFNGCMNVADISIPDSVTSIGGYAFCCTKLTRIEIPGAVTRINEWTFAGCEQLTDIVIHDGITSIGYEAFRSCVSLTSIIIPAGVTDMEGRVFMDCNDLTIYCEAQTQPDTWDSDWNITDCAVVWGYQADLFNVSIVKKTAVLRLSFFNCI